MTPSESAVFAHSRPAGDSRPWETLAAHHDAVAEAAAAHAAGFGFAAGRVHAVHTAFSGNHIHYAERVSTGECLLGGAEQQ